MTDERSARYRVPARPVRVENRIEKSRFIASAARAESAAAAREFVDSLRAEFPDATHHCFAFVAGPPGSSNAVGSSDDGEPSGTAGRPMLSVLMNSGIGEIVVVVTRYFGGVKLGKGGLVRAYTGATQHALREMPTMERVSIVELRITISYAHADAVRRAIERAGGTIADEAFDTTVTVVVRVPDDRRVDLERELRDVTSGSVKIE
ncbi:MAG TPA: YigZ family protein [Candidatus Krumholzibacteria bacterium]|nr:YigZ family protein [Candidatus Krumholzibacteria bacterium]